MLYLMFNSTQLFLESLKTSQEMLFSQAFNHPSSVTAVFQISSIPKSGIKKKKRFFFSPSLFKTMLHFVFTAEYL